MASALFIYNAFRKYIADGTLDLDSDTIKVALVESVYFPDVAVDAVWADVSANEVAAGDGYAAGGQVLANSQVTESGGVAVWDADDMTWPALTKTFRYGVIYAEKTVNGITNPLIGYVLFDDTPADVSVAGIDFLIQWSTSGIYTFS